ncbi:MAG TPA: hypothetical protein VI456_03635, partial [Polyangia bacterium]
TAAVGDAAVRYDFIDGNHDHGLRGGTVSYSPSHGRFIGHLHAVRWTTDSTVSGLVRFPEDGLAGFARVTITAAHHRFAATIRWSATRPGRRAKVRIAGRVIDVPSP